MAPEPRADLSRTWALVPIRGLESAKSRLGEGLDPEERVALVTELLRRTLGATRGAERIAGTIVVTMDPAAAGIAKAHRAIGLVERAPGLDAAIVAARSLAIARGATAVVVLPADLPAVSAAALDEALGTVQAATLRSPGRATVGLVPDRHGSGTNLLVVSPPAAIEPAFGLDSRERHADAAHAAGAQLVEIDGPLAFDVDTPADLELAETAIGGLRG